MNQIVLNAENVRVSVENRHLICDIHTQIHQGEILAVVGPNGAGKTTLLNAITGDQALDLGHISLCGKSMAEWSIQEKAKLMAALPQFSLLNFPYTVNEVVSLGRIPHNTGFKIDQKIVAEAMARMDIEHLADRPYPQLSGGEKQRTQLARVMAQIWRAEDAPMRLLLLDEPTTALDLGHQQQLMDAVKQFANDGVAVFMVVHDINIAAKYADTILALSNGQCLAQGAANTILKEDMLRQLFNTPLHTVQHPHTGRTAVLL